MAGGSILLAHNPPKWVNFARRFTLLAEQMLDMAAMKELLSKKW